MIFRVRATRLATIKRVTIAAPGMKPYSGQPQREEDGPMKKALLVGSIAVVIFVYGVAVGYYQFPPFNIMRIAKQQLRLEEALEPWLGSFRWREGPIDVAMLGDSITAEGGWAELFPEVKILNLGLAGDTSAGLLNRLGDVVDRKPRMVFLMIGVNDFLMDIPLELVAAHIQFIASRLAENGILPVVQSTLYVSNDVGKEINGRIKALNSLLREWCTEKAIIYVDLNNALSVNDALLSRFSYDGRHLNGEAYVVWREVIKDYVQRPPLGP
jgi:lysophospholipase L1-like esterase